MLVVNAYKKPGPWKRTLEVFSGLLSLYFIRRTCLLFAYYIINYVNGYRLCTKGRGVNIHPTVILRHPENITIGSHSFINHNNVLQGGKCSAKIIIGRKVMTGPNVMMFAYNHGIEDSGIAMIDQPYTEADILIDDDVWIGAGSVILAGANIGTGAVIAAGSVVRGEIQPNSIYGGVPAKLIKSRSCNERCMY